MPASGAADARRYAVDARAHRNAACHPERSEGSSRAPGRKIPRCARHDMGAVARRVRFSRFNCVSPKNIAPAPLPEWERGWG